MAGNDRTRSQATAAEHAQLVAAFEGTNSVFSLLASLRSRRMGKGYSVEPGVEEVHAVTGRTQWIPEGPLSYQSQSGPQPLSEVEEALILWAAGGPNGTIILDAPRSVFNRTFLCTAGRTIPGPCNDSQVQFFVVNDRGVFFWNPTRHRDKPVEIEGPDDYDKVLTWYREGLVEVSSKRSDFDLSCGIPGGMISEFNWNFNKPGSTIIIPVSEFGLEQVNLMPTFYARDGVFFVDDDGEPCVGTDFLEEHPELTMPVPLREFEEMNIQSADYPVGMAVANMRLAAEALGLGNWIMAGFSEDLVLGAMPEFGKGLGFVYHEDETTGRRFAMGLPGVFEGYGMPSPWWESVDEMVDTVVALRYDNDGVFFGEHTPSGSTIERAPYREEYLAKVRELSELHWPDAAIEATKRDIQHCLDKYGRYPVNFSPMQCQFIIQLHHVDTEYYDRHYVSGYITSDIRDHDAHWHADARE